MLGAQLPIAGSATVCWRPVASSLHSRLYASEDVMTEPLERRIMQNGPGWYWEVLTPDRGVIARGVADTHAQARADADKVSRDPPTARA